MSSITRNYEKIDMQFDFADDLLIVRFADPSYVRAETVIYNKADSGLYAVMYGGLYYIGDVPEQFCEGLVEIRGVQLTSCLPCGQNVCMTARLAVSDLASNNITHEALPQLLPIFAAVNDGLRAES